MVFERGGHWSVRCWENLAAGRWIVTFAADTCNRGRRLSWGEGIMEASGSIEKSPDPTLRSPRLIAPTGKCQKAEET